VAGQQFTCSWTSGGEPSGTINVRSEVGVVVLSFRVAQLPGARYETYRTASAAKQNNDAINAMRRVNT
jgi:ribosomal protein S12